MFKHVVAAFLCLGLVVGVTGLAGAGETGHYTPGVDFFENGSLPEQPGMYMKNYFIHYEADELRDKNGHKVDGSFKVNSTMLVNRFIYVTGQKLLGADWAVHAIVPLAYNKVTNPMGQRGTQGGLGDIMLEPLLLGWHGPQWDSLIGLGLYLPTGEWSRNEPANIGKDFYTGMFSAGMTWYFDTERTWKAGGRVRYEVHSDNDTLDIRHGDDMTVEWSFSKAVTPTIEVGVAGYCQWQVTRDSGSDVYWDKSVKDRVYGVGPEVRFTVPSINGMITLNYTREFGAVDRPEGQLYGVSLTLAF